MIFQCVDRNRLRILTAVTAIAACISMAGSAANAQAVAARIGAEVSSSEMAVLPGSQPPMARAEFDAGRMPANTPLIGMTLWFNRSAAQQSDLNALLAAQQNPGSPLYHQWLSPEQFGARFGMAQADLDKVELWLQQQGFKIESVNRSRTGIQFSGTVGQIESAFRTEMHYYSQSGRQEFAPSTALSVPAAIAPTVASVGNLTSFRPQSSHISANRAGVSPAFTSGSSGNVFFAPGDLQVVYDMKTLTGGGFTGTGQSIAVVGQSSISLSDIENFQKAAGLTVQDPTLVLVPLSGTPAVRQGDQGESDLDLEWSGGIATGANLLFVYTGNSSTYNVYNSIEYAVDEKLAQIISVSYGTCETAFGSAGVTSFEGVLQQATTQGQTIVVASGDQGSTECNLPGLYTTLSAAQQQALAVNYPASSAYATGVGGTEINQSNAAYSTAGSGYWSSASGTDVITSALQYIPEVSWNDDTTTGCIDPVTSLPSGCLAASGGGASQFVAKPSWQATLTPNDTKRDVPDIALYSSPGHPGYLFCTSDTSDWQTSVTPAQQGSCNNGFRDAATGYLTVAGGTSFATPIFAGMLAILNQHAGYDTGQGNINGTLYTLATSSGAYSAAKGFHDITTGSNDCLADSTYCTGAIGFTAGTGYDQVTGLGSIDLGLLAGNWTASNSTLVGTVTALNATVNNPNVGANDVVTIKVTPDSGTATPAGSVTLNIDGGTSFGGSTVTGLTLGTGGTVQYTANFTTKGPHQIIAEFSDSSNTFASSTGVIALTVTVLPTVAVTPALSSISAGQPLSVTVAVSGGTGNPTPTGTVTLTSGSYTSAATALASGSATISIPAGSLAAGSDTLTATYAPDTAGAATYSGATGTAAVAVTAIKPTVTVTPASSSISASQPLSVTVAVSGGTGNPTPTGTVTLTSGSYTSSATTLANGSATISVPAGKLSAGSDTLTATYTPDTAGSATYLSSTGTSSVSVGTMTPTVTVSPSASSITAAQPLSVTVAVSGGTGNPTPTGTVTLTSGSYTSSATTLANGSATISVPAGKLAAGSDTLTATYAPDTAGAATYSGATGTAVVTVTTIKPTVTVTPASSSVSTGQPLSVTVAVSGGTGNPTPTGTVTLTSGSYTSAATALASGSATIVVPAGSLAAGSDTLTANYAPDTTGAATYSASTGSAAVTVTTIKPTVTVTPASSSISTAQALSVTVAVNGGTGNPTPTGTVTLTSGTYTSAATPLASGSATISVPAGSLAAGSDTLTANYTPDTAGSKTYSAATGAGSVTVGNPALINPTVTVTPASSSVATGQALSVSVVVNGGTGNPTPTGAVTLTSGAFTSTATPLAGGSATINIPAGSLTAGNDTLTANYTPDATSASVYNGASGASSVTVTSSGYSISATAVTVSAGTPGTSTITVSSTSGYAGTVTLSCKVTSSPANASNLPTCLAGQAVTLGAGTTSGTSTVTVNTTAPTTALLSMPGSKRSLPWGGAGGGAMLAALVLMGLPAKRRKWLSMMVVVLAMAALGGLVACGGGSSSSTTGTTIPGTTPGAYTLTVSGTGNDSASTQASTTFTLTVN